MDLSVAAGLPETTVAMLQVARAELSSDILRAQKFEDYSIPFDRIMFAFDSFIKEWSSGKKRAGYLENYDLSNPRDFTILLLWQIRHIRTHAGGLISEEQDAKDRYEKHFREAIERGIKPIIDMPEILEIGHEFTFTFQDYKEIKNAIFDYIGERIPKKEWKILQTRSIVSSINTQGIMIDIEIDDVGLVEADLSKLFDIGIEVDLQTGALKSSSHIAYLHGLKSICVSKTGACVPVQTIQSHVKKRRKRKK